MATITGYTAARMQEIEDNTVVDGHISGTNLILEKRNGEEIDAGNVRGPAGPTGPAGDLTDAPEDGNRYARKDGAWFPLLNAPEDSRRYALRNGVYVAIDKAWKLEFTNGGPTPPTGFTTGALTAGAAWSVSLIGSGNVVTFNLTYFIDGTAVSSSPRMNFPAGLRPVSDFNTVAFLGDNGFPDPWSAPALGIFKADGSVLMPQHVPGLMASEDSDDLSHGKIEIRSGAVSVKVFMTGTFIRSVADMPSGAVLV